MLRIKPLKQSTGYTCGPTCVAMLGKFYDLRFSWAEILRACNIDRNGMSNEDLVKALRKLGFLVRAKSRNTWTELKKNYTRGLPMVVAWMLHGYIGHFSIVVEVGKNHIVLADPDNGKHRRMSKEVFMRLWFDYDGVFFPKRARDISLRWALSIHGIRR